MRNEFEKQVSRQLKRAGVDYAYEPKRIPYYLAFHYWPDFIYHTPSGAVVLECKGYLRPGDKRKLMAVKRQHPEIDLRILFYEYREKQVKWAEKNVFTYAIKTIPEEWFL